MKITQELLFIILPFLFLFRAFDSNAQQLREMQPLEVHDFECLQSLECVQKSHSLKSKGWAFVFDNTADEYHGELTAHMKGENIFFYAVYDKEGNLMRSHYKRKEVALPRCLLAHITENNSGKWRISDSQMILKNFDPATVKYKVMLESNTSERSEVYDFEFVNRLHVQHEGLVKHGLF